MKAANTYLNFNGNTEEAFNFYRSVFAGEFQAVVRFSDAGGESFGIPAQDLDKIMHIALPIGGNSILMGTDSLESIGQKLNVGNNVYIILDVDSPEEAEKLFDGLSEGGKVEMPLNKTEWAERYGICADKYGVQWMVNYTGNVQFGG